MSYAHKLSPDEEKRLFEAYFSSKDTAIRDTLLAAYDYLPQILAHRFSGRGMEYDDIYQCARIGLMNALSRFEPEKNNRFSTYATPTIIGEIKRLFRDKGHFIKVPRRIYEIFSKAIKLKASHLTEGGEALTTKELAELSGVSEKQMEEALEWGDKQFVHSLEQFVCNGEDEMLFSNVVGVEDNQFLMIENREFISTFMNSLSERERDFVKLRYYDEMTQSSIAKKLGISQMNVSRMEKRVLAQLKELYFEAVNNQ